MLKDVPAWWQDDGEWVVVETGHARWHVLLPPAPPRSAGRHARVGAGGFELPLPAAPLSDPAEASARGNSRRLGAWRFVLRLVLRVGRSARWHRRGTRS